MVTQLLVLIAVTALTLFGLAYALLYLTDEALSDDEDAERSARED